MNPKVHTTIRTVASVLFLVLFAALPWLTPAKALAALGSLTAIVGGALALSNLFHVPAKARVVMQAVLDVLGDLSQALPAATRDAAKKIAGAALLLLALGGAVRATTACTQQQAQTANNWINGGLSAAQYACTQASELTDAPQLAIVCGIISAGEKVAPAVEQFLETLILGRQAQIAKGLRFDRVGLHWVKPQ